MSHYAAIASRPVEPALVRRAQRALCAIVVAAALSACSPVLGFLALGTLLLPFAFVPPFVGPSKPGPIGEGLFFGILFALVLQVLIHMIDPLLVVFGTLQQAAGNAGWCA
jgi:hypothetical protein